VKSREQNCFGKKPGRKVQAGFTMIELVIALVILWIIGTALVAVFATAMARSNSQGELATRATELAHDKMEYLMGLYYNDTNLVSSVNPEFFDPVMCQCGTTCNGTAATCSTASGSTAPAGAMFQRTWTVARETSNPSRPMWVLSVTASVVPGKTLADIAASSSSSGSSLVTTTLISEKGNF
jgi:type II secretory pathway pseudopilin PulG